MKDKPTPIPCGLRNLHTQVIPEDRPNPYWDAECAVRLAIQKRVALRGSKPTATRKPSAASAARQALLESL